jgi:AraC-like DNA-binding protein
MYSVMYPHGTHPFFSLSSPPYIYTGTYLHTQVSMFIMLTYRKAVLKLYCNSVHMIISYFNDVFQDFDEDTRSRFIN